MFRVHYIQFVS